MNAPINTIVTVENVTYIAKLSCLCGYKKYVKVGEQINKRCPLCKTWLNVRLFPKMDNYVK